MMKLYKVDSKGKFIDVPEPSTCVLDPEVFAQLALDTTLIPKDNVDADLIVVLAAQAVGLGGEAMVAFCMGFDTGLQYMELLRRSKDMKEFEKSLGIKE